MSEIVKGARLALCLLLVAAALAACGKKGRPVPPEGEEAQYTYPRQYPAPSSVVPGAQGQEPRRTTTIFLLPQPDGQ